MPAPFNAVGPYARDEKSRRIKQVIPVDKTDGFEALYKEDDGSLIREPVVAFALTEWLEDGEVYTRVEPMILDLDSGVLELCDTVFNYAGMRRVPPVTPTPSDMSALTDEMVADMVADEEAERHYAALGKLINLGHELLHGMNYYTPESLYGRFDSTLKELATFGLRSKA